MGGHILDTSRDLLIRLDGGAMSGDQQTSKPANQQTSKPANHQASKQCPPQTTDPFSVAIKPTATSTTSHLNSWDGTLLGAGAVHLDGRSHCRMRPQTTSFPEFLPASAHLCCPPRFRKSWYPYDTGSTVQLVQLDDPRPSADEPCETNAAHRPRSIGLLSRLPRPEVLRFTRRAVHVADKGTPPSAQSV